MGWVIVNTSQCSVCGGKVHPRTSFTKAFRKPRGDLRVHRTDSSIPHLAIQWNNDTSIGVSKDRTPVLFCSQNCLKRLEEEILAEDLLDI